ncbi:MAG: tetratricopeptide repeat protein [Candidatus Micrarchaeota archaeon]|nr:tetratricopeptide repeat protein [Candidatus Micrarchaeota archaeon]
MADELVDEMVARTEELLEEKKIGEAEQEANELAKIDPKDAIAWFVKGKVHYLEKQFDDALVCFSKAAEIDNENPHIWHLMGYCLISLNRLQEAEEALAYVKAVQPDNVEAITALAICQILQKKEQEAKTNLFEAIRLNKQLSISIVEHFYESTISTSQEVSSSTKAMIERAIETLRILHK